MEWWSVNGVMWVCEGGGVECSAVESEWSSGEYVQWCGCAGEGLYGGVVKW